MSRIARTMFNLETRNEAIPIVAIVIRKPIEKPVSRSDHVQLTANAFPPKPVGKIWAKPQRMMAATSKPAKVPTTEDRSA